MLKHRNDQKVVVAYPRPHDVPGRFMECLLGVWRYDAIGGRDTTGKKVGGKQHILTGGGHITRSTALLTRARTDIVSDFLDLKHEPDWLWMVDTDMTFEPDIVDRLLLAAHPEQRPIVGGLCFAYRVDQPRKFWPTLYTFSEGNQLGYITQYPENELIPVAGTGAACLLVHRTVLERLRDDMPGDPRPWFDEVRYKRPDGVIDTLSEDLTFCLRAQKAGFPVHVHTGVKLGHIKSFEADEDRFIEECEQLVGRSTPQLPTFVVVASKSRYEMLGNLLGQLQHQVSDAFVFDNGYPEPIPGAIEAHGWPLHRMWNEGLDRAAKACSDPHNVLIINDDVEVPPDFCARLEAGLRAKDDHWIAYPDIHGIQGVPDGVAGPTKSDAYAGQTMSGWAFMVRGETGLRVDERFSWWYGDTDLQKTVEQQGKQVVCVSGCHANHLDPLRSTLDDPERLEQARHDEKLYAEKWGINPERLWLAVNRP